MASNSCRSLSKDEPRPQVHETYPKQVKVNKNRNIFRKDRKKPVLLFFPFPKSPMAVANARLRSIKEEQKLPVPLLMRKESLRFSVRKDLRDIAERVRKNKIGDAALLPSSKDSVKGLHGSQYLLRFVEKSLSKGKTQSKRWMLDAEVLCSFLLMTKQKDPVSCQGASGLIPTCRGPQTLQRRRPMTKR